MFHLSSWAVAPLLLAMLRISADWLFAEPSPPVFARVASRFPESPHTHVFAVTAPVGGDELLVVRERQFERAGSWDAETFIAARRMKARYEVRVTDVGSAVKVETSAGDWRYPEMVLGAVRFTGGVLRIELADARSREPRGALVWSARVETMASFARRHPEYRPPEGGRWFLSWYRLGRYRVADSR